MPTYVCSFCRGDHGAAECREQVCINCYRTEEYCTCKLNSDEETKFPACDAINQINEDFVSAVADADWEALNLQFGEDSPIECFRHMVATYEINEDYAYLKALFPSAKDDGKVYNASRKHGGCYHWAYSTLLDETAIELEDGEACLVHGYVKHNAKQYGGHGWIETDKHVIDCGTIEREFNVVSKEFYYQSRGVKHPTKYLKDEALKHLTKLGNYGPWGAVPDDIPIATTRSPEG